MSRTAFQPTMFFSSNVALTAALPTLQRGQWINFDGARGRVVGMGHSVWIAWGRTARDCKSFKRMCGAFTLRGATAA